MPLIRMSCRSIPIGVVWALSSLFLQHNTLNAQSTNVKPVIDPATQQTSAKTRLVSLKLVDISVESALIRIAETAKMELSWDRSRVPVNAGNISATFENKPVEEAVKQVLKGTQATTRISKDGKTIWIVPQEKDSVKRDSAAAKVGRITGVIIDASNKQPVFGAMVSIMGLGYSIVTDVDGRFIFGNVPVGTRTVVVKILGYAGVSRTVEVVESEAKEVSIALNYVPERLREVVTTGAGERKRVEVGTSVTRIEADSLMKTMPIISVEDLIKSRAPGTQVLISGGTVGTGSRIRIRGVSGLLTNSDPIVIVDGVRIDATYSAVAGAPPREGIGGGMSRNQASGNASATSRINDIDPETIESIEILKGPSASSLFGSDAANGVIVIRTKRGKAGPARWSLGLEGGLSRMHAKFPETYFAWGNGPEWPTSQNCRLDMVSAGTCDQDSITSYNPLNVKESSPFGTGRNSSFNTQVSGGTNQMKYFLGFTTKNEVGLLKMPDTEKERILEIRQGVPLPSWAERPNVNRTNNVSANISTEVASRLNVDVDIRVMSGYHRDAEQGAVSFIRNAMLGPGYRDSIGKGWGENGPALGFLRRISDAVRRGSGGTNARLRASERIFLNGTGGVDFSTRRDENLLRTEDLLESTDHNSSLARYSGEIVTVTSNLSGVFEMPFANGMTSRTTTGMQFIGTRNSSLYVRVIDLAPGRDVIDAGTIDVAPSETRYESATQGWFFDQNFMLRPNLFVTAALRGDVGSSFGSESKPMLYPKFNSSWIISDESFFNANTVITSLRLRAAFGQAGIQPGPAARFRSYTSNYLWVDGSQQPTYILSSIGNTNVVPERSMEFEGGFEAGILNDRIVLDVTGYYKRVKNALISRSLPTSFGLSARQENLGNVKNTGREISLAVRAVDRDMLSWNISMGYSSSNDKLIKLGAHTERLGRLGERYVEGYPLTGLWARPLVSYGDKNNDGIISADEILMGDSAVFLGSQTPNAELSLFNNMRFMNGRILFSSGFNYTHDMTQTNTVMSNQCTSNRCAIAVVPGTSLAQQAVFQSLLTTTDAVRNAFATYEKASWLRWGSVSLTLSATPEFAKRLKSNSLSLSLMGRNLAVWSNYRGPDPEVNSSTNGNGTVDMGIVPQTRDWTIRINMGF